MSGNHLPKVVNYNYIINHMTTPDYTTNYHFDSTATESPTALGRAGSRCHNKSFAEGFACL
jgi:hypothetical protein